MNRPTRHTSEMTATSAQVCREMNWTRGTVLEAETQNELVAADRIQITAVGDELVLARALLTDGNEQDLREAVYDLTCRDWKEV